MALICLSPQTPGPYFFYEKSSKTFVWVCGGMFRCEIGGDMWRRQGEFLKGIVVLSGCGYIREPREGGV